MPRLVSKPLEGVLPQVLRVVAFSRALKVSMEAAALLKHGFLGRAEGRSDGPARDGRWALKRQPHASVHHP